MLLQFTRPEIEQMRSYLRKVASADTQTFQPDLPEWKTVYLLLRKLLAYGVYYVATPVGQDISYTDLQTKTQKSADMLIHVHVHLDIFEQLLDTYVANQRNTQFPA